MNAALDNGFVPPEDNPIDSYQKDAVGTSLYVNQRLVDVAILGPALELASEVGEVVGQVKRIIRDDYGVLTPERRAKLEDEIGDCAWALATLAAGCGLKLSKILERNNLKLMDRKARGVIQGEGGNR